MGRTVRRSNPCGGKIFRTHPDCPWGPPSLLHDGYRVSFPGLKWPGCGVDHRPPSSAKVKERVALYLYSPSGPSWPVLGWTLPLCSYKYLLISGEEANPEHEISQWISQFQQLRKSTQQHGNILDILSSKNNKILDGIICTACLSITKSLIQYSKNHTPQEFREFLSGICVDLQIQNEGVCAGLIDIHLVIEFHSYNKNVLLHRWICWPW